MKMYTKTSKLDNIQTHTLSIPTKNVDRENSM